MVWATVSSWSCFCWLYRASPSLAAKNINNLISVWTIWWCPCIESSLVLLEDSVCYDQYILLAKVCLPLPCFILFSKAKFALYYRYLLTSYFFIPVSCKEKDIFFRDFSSRRSCRSSQNHSTITSSALLVGAWTWITVILNGLPWKRREIIVSFLISHPSTAFQTLVWLWGLRHSFKGFLPTVIDIMIIWIKFSHSSPL